MGWETSAIVSNPPSRYWPSVPIERAVGQSARRLFGGECGGSRAFLQNLYTQICPPSGNRKGWRHRVLFCGSLHERRTINKVLSCVHMQNTGANPIPILPCVILSVSPPNRPIARPTANGRASGDVGSTEWRLGCGGPASDRMHSMHEAASSAQVPVLRESPPPSI